MQTKIKISLLFLAFPLIAGCARLGPHAGFMDTLKDNFLGTTAGTLPKAKRQCLYLPTKYRFKSGDTDFILPKGKYLGKQANATGVFYDAPSKVIATNWAIENEDGIYLNATHTKGFTFKYSGEYYRPVRAAVLPGRLIKLFRRIAC